jgi:hypothetical protein
MRQQRYVSIWYLVDLLHSQALAEGSLVEEISSQTQEQKPIKARSRWRSRLGDWLRRLVDWVDPPEPQT